eukprot:jgi/Bigna1/39964/e_gw1.37.43.1
MHVRTIDRHEHGDYDTEGTAGAGKSTYCRAMRDFLESLGRPCAIINMDPGNELFPYECDVDVMELVSMAEVMKTMGLGPNGALVFCMEYIEANIEWLRQKVAGLHGKYLLFDFPGQIELYVMHDSCKNICRTIVDDWNIRLVAVNMLDSIHARTASHYITALCVTLSTMLHIALPHINLLTKFGRLSSS